MSELLGFKYHPMYKKLKLAHLIFADDSMIFCKGDLGSVTRVIEALTHFGKASGLVANMEKSSVLWLGLMIIQRIYCWLRQASH